MPPAHPVSAPPRSLYDPDLGETVTFVETAADSGGRRSLVELDLAPRAEDPPHHHDAYEERLEVLDGTLTVEVDGVVRVMGPGETVVVPPGSRHRVCNQTGRSAAVRLELRPGHEGFERALQVAYGLAADHRPRTLSHAALLAAWEGRRPVGSRVRSGLLAVCAHWARRRGLDRELTARYCVW